jgi:hypothetical protein
MSTLVTLICGCRARLEEPSRIRTIADRARTCQMQSHRVGARVWLWESLIDPRGPSIDDERDVSAPEPYQYLRR